MRLRAATWCSVRARPRLTLRQWSLSLVVSPPRQRSVSPTSLRVLEGAGLGPQHVIKANVYLTNMDTFSEMNATYKTMFELPYPARTTIGVAALPLGASVEIELIATRS